MSWKSSSFLFQDIDVFANKSAKIEITTPNCGLHLKMPTHKREATKMQRTTK